MILDLVERARRRLLWLEALSQAMYAVGGAFAAMSILLVLGTQLLDWRWLLLVPAATLGIGVYFTCRRLPSPYRTVQILDRRLALADTLATAWYFARRQGRDISAMVGRLLFDQAERMARTVDLRAAFPLRFPRAAYAAAILAAVAAGLFGLRYGLSRRLDLRAPLAGLVREHFSPSPRPGSSARNNLRRPPYPPGWEELGMALGDDQQLPGDAFTDPGHPAAASDLARQQKGAVDRNADPEAREGEPIPGDESGEGAEDGEDSSGTPQGADGQPGQSAKQDGRKDAAQQDPGVPKDQNNLMAKLKEAMQNLLNKMKIQPQGTGAQQQAQAGQGNRQSKGQPGGKKEGRDGQPRPGNPREDGGQEGQTSQEGQNAEGSQNRSAGQNANEQASKQPGSGIGKNEGDKDVRAAEQLAAMGKISEIIGKRSANVSGEATVEVRHSTQQLSTPYASQRAEHGESGAAISRDEVPVALQPYVEQYFEAVRKQKK